MKNRLQLRYCEKIFSGKTEIESYLHELFLSQNNPLKGTSLIAEPLVLFYKEEGDSVEAKKAVIAIGRDGDGKSTGYADYFLIDFAGVDKKVDGMTSIVSGVSVGFIEVKEKLDQEISARTESIKALSGSVLEEINREVVARSGDTKMLLGLIKNICNSVELNNDGEDMGTLSGVCFDHRYIQGARTVIDAIRKVAAAAEVISGNVKTCHDELDSALTVSMETIICGRTLTSYNLKQKGQIIGRIDIPTDWKLKKGEIVKGKWNGDVFYKNLGDDLAMQFTLQNEKGDITGDEDSIYVKLNHLINLSGNGISIVEQSDNKKVISLKLDVNPETAKYLSVSANGLKLSGIEQDLQTVKEEAIEGSKEFAREVCASTINYANNVVSSGAIAYANSVLVSAKTYTDEKAVELKDYADNVLVSAKTYTDEKNTELKEYVDNADAAVKAYADSAISRAVSSVYRVKGSVTYITDLDDRTLIPNPQKGDVYNVIESAKTQEGVYYAPGTNFVFVGSGESIYGRTYHGWDPLGGETVDMSVFVKHEYFANYSAATEIKINTVDAKADAINEKVNELSGSVISEFAAVRNEAKIFSGSIISYVDAADELLKADIDVVSGNVESVKNELVAFSGAVISYVDGKETTINNKINELSATTENLVSASVISLKEYADEKDKAVEVKVQGAINNVLDGYGEVNLESATTKKISVIKNIEELSAVTEAGKYLIDAFAIKQMYENLIVMISGACNETMVRNCVADMVEPVSNEIKVEKVYEEGTTDVSKLKFGFADDAIFEAQLPQE